MFWLKRLKTDTDRTGWMLPYADMMSLLLAIFVLIAAMSEFRPGRQFSEISRAVRGSFGFRLAPEPVEAGPPAAAASGLLARLAAEAMNASGTVPAGSGADDPLSMFEVTAGVDRLTVRVTDPAAFEPVSGVLAPHARHGVRCLGDVLADATSRIEVRAVVWDRPDRRRVREGEAPAVIPRRDTWDEARARVRDIVAVLGEAGVRRERLETSVREVPAVKVERGEATRSDVVEVEIVVERNQKDEMPGPAL